mmetsp:Transcript_63490/g.196510  ORF Transcript_63490/g.196510 Transcript_63490/m.196510 type:complete len:310 (+) Transcript_63490:40-969(+)
MPSAWDFDVDAGDIEEDALPLPVAEQEHTFEGQWRATTLLRGKPSRTVVTISGSNVWHRGSQYATLKLVNQSTCVLIMRDQDVKGYLSDDGSTIDWDDGDIWPRAVQAVQQVRPIPAQVTTNGTTSEVFAKSAAGEADGGVEAAREPAFSAADAASFLLARDAKRLADALCDGVPADSVMEPAVLWRELRWEPQWRGDSPRTPLLIAAILLQWAEGVEVCVRYGADVNGTYFGPFRQADGTLGSEAAGAPILRVALSAQGPAQCTICQHVLGGKISRKTFLVVRKKAKAEMDFVTAGFFERFDGPFLKS